MISKPTRLYVDNRSLGDKVRRALWHLTRSLLFASLPGPLFNRWRLFLLRSFGATIGEGCRVDHSCKIWWPGNLTMGNYACLAHAVDCYNVARISIGDYATVSQRSFLCSASHATHQLSRPLIFAPITIETHAWIGAEAFVGPGVTIGAGAVLGARAVAVRDLAPWTIYAGVPARTLKKREIRE